MSEVRQEDKYRAIKFLNDTEKYPITKLCNFIHVARSSYYKWRDRTPSLRQQINEQVVKWIKRHYEETNGILGYRQMTITINREHDVHYNKKRIYRLMQLLHLKSVTRIKKKKYIPSNSEITAKNTLNRDFHADAPNEKWLTDVTEFKYYDGSVVKKLYLRACLVSRSMQIARQILCISRQFFAEILYVFQEKLTKKYAKYASKMRAERY